MSSGHVAAEQLRLFIERVERLKEEIKNLQEDVKDVFNEAKGQGFDKKTMVEIIKLRAMTPEARREREALIDTYRAALGMLDGTPLGTWAVKRLSKPKEDDDAAPAPATAPDDAEPSEPVEAPVSLEEAKKMGGDAARAGEPVTANPFPARDARRAAWDEAWCHELGSDGMDIPDALKPAPKPKKGGGDEADEKAPKK